MARTPRSDSGMTLLLEIVLGLGIFTAALLFIMGIFTMSHKSTTSAKNLAVASQLAREVMEQQIAIGYPSIVTLAPVEVPMPATINGVDVITNFTVLVEAVEEPAGAPPNDFAKKRVLVTINWREGTGADRTTKLETYVVE